MKRIVIIGAGGWGTALALVLHGNGHAVRLWGHTPDYIARVRRERENALYLPGIPLPAALEWTASRDEAVAGADAMVLAVPSSYSRAVFRSFAGLVPRQTPLISVSKGLDPESRQRMSVLAATLLGAEPITVLSGPSHAEEVARGVPTAVVAACTDTARTHWVQTLFMSPRFRVYTSDDVIGVELGGVLKNVMALAVGASDGLGFGDNTRAALIARGLAEITRLGVALGARAETFAGLSGIGDLMVTCTSRWSRNRMVGERLGRGEPLDRIVSGMRQVAEGVSNCALVRDLARAHTLDAPITEAVYALLQATQSPAQVVDALLSRAARPERDL